MDLGISGKTAFVSGASRGLGRSICLELASAGCSIIASSRKREDLDSLRIEVEKIGVACQTFTCDFSVPSSVKALLDQLKTSKVNPDILVHNAGGSLGVTDHRAPSEMWQKVWYFNLGASIELNNFFLESLEKKRWGRVVHIASSTVDSFGGNSPYVSAKCALVGYVKSLARFMAKSGIVVSAVSPGALNNPGRYLSNLQSKGGGEWDSYCENHLSIGRLAEPEEIAKGVAFLCSTQASYAVGAILGLDGGTK